MGVATSIDIDLDQVSTDDLLEEPGDRVNDMDDSDKHALLEMATKVRLPGYTGSLLDDQIAEALGSIMQHGDKLQLLKILQAMEK